MKKVGLLILMVLLMGLSTTFAQKEKVKAELSVKDFYETTDIFQMSSMGNVEYADDSGKITEVNAAYMLTFVFVLTKNESVRMNNIFQKDSKCTFKIKTDNVNWGGSGKVMETTYINNVFNVKILTNKIVNKK